jgi:hypothetical protein
MSAAPFNRERVSKVLPLRPIPIQFESLSDYLDRLADVNGYRASELWQAIYRPEFTHKQLLSQAIGGHTLPTFSGPAVRLIDIPVEMHGLRPNDYTHRLRRWCPLCVAKQGHLEPIWRLKVCTVCPIHEVSLLQHDNFWAM